MNFRFKKQEIGIFNDGPDKIMSTFDNGCNIFGLTMGEYSLIDIIHSVLKKTGRSNVCIATWSAGIKDAHQVEWMSNTGLISDLMILTDHSYKTRQAKYAASIEQLFGIERIRTSEMHAKFVLIANDSFKVSIVSSMNLNANKTCELFQIVEGEDLYSFLHNFVQYHFDYQQPGFVADSSKVNETVKNFFSQFGNVSNKNHWSDI